MGELIGTTGPLIVQIEQGRKGFSEKYAKLFSTILDFPMSEFGRIRKEVVKQRNVVLPLSLFDVDDGD